MKVLDSRGGIGFFVAFLGGRVPGVMEILGESVQERVSTDTPMQPEVQDRVRAA